MVGWTRMTGVPAVLEAVLIGLLISQIAFVVTTVYLHRTLAHRAITMKPAVMFACRFIIWMSTGTRPRQWVAVHRKHHAYTDKEGDPHSPAVFGYASVQFGNALLYRRVARDPVAVARYARDLPGDRWDKVLFDHALLGLGVGVGLLIGVFGLEIGLIAAGVHASVYLLGGGACGYSRADDERRQRDEPTAEVADVHVASDASLTAPAGRQTSSCTARLQ